MFSLTLQGIDMILGNGDPWKLKKIIMKMKIEFIFMLDLSFRLGVVPIYTKSKSKLNS